MLSCVCVEICNCVEARMMKLIEKERKEKCKRKMCGHVRRDVIKYRNM